MKNVIALAAITSLGLGSLPALGDNFTIDAEGAHASINFKIQHLGYSWLTGRFNDFNGEFNYDPDDVTKSAIKVSIDTSSVDTDHSERDKHLRSDDFLHTSEYPEATFISTEVIAPDDDSDEFEIVGDQTLHGVTKSVTIKAKKVGAGEDPWGGYRIGFTGKTKLNLKDFGIDHDLGEASETVYLELHVEGIRQ